MTRTKNETVLNLGPILLGTVPAGSSVERLEDGSIMAFLPDGSAKRFSLCATHPKVLSRVDTFPPIKITVGKA